MRYKIDTSVKLVKHTYPGPPVRPIPRFSIDIPTHWLMTEFPGALFAMAPAADAPGPWSNVVIRHDRVLPTETLETLGAATRDLFLAEFPDADIIGEQIAQIGAHEFHLRNAELAHPNWHERVNRTDTLVFGPTQDQTTADIFHITWMCSAAATAEVSKLQLRVLETLRFNS